VLALVLALFGPILVCCVTAYFRWQLPDVPSDQRLAPIERGACCTEDMAFPVDRIGSPESVRGRSAPLGPRRRLELPRGPGVYVAATREADGDERHAAIRGQLLADRIIHGRFDARREPRRGRRGALDVIVVGANAVGVSAALYLAHAGWRVLVVDRDTGAAPSAESRIQQLSRAQHGERSARLALLTGHSVCAVAERADGMLEVQAERAAWYTANVIVASTESWTLPAATDLASRRSASPSRAA
jgi:hypothetical protein